VLAESGGGDRPAERVRKEWGHTQAIDVQPGMQVHRATIEPGGFCSWHEHQAKWNAFLVVSGEVRIETAEGNRVLGPGEYLAVPPLVRHRFRSEPGAEVIELYWPAEVSTDDIVRYSAGGIA
jgi:mannose-6-phosphate isomerase-like protein (cupin superfamily)